MTIAWSLVALLLKLFEFFSIFNNTTKVVVGNMSSAVCAFSIYSRLCMKIISFLSMRTWAMPRTSYLSCGIPFPV